ncbi:MAG: SDR family oxidoreductase [Verrucomicrobiota bacterium]
MSLLLVSRVVWITGCSRGLGRAMVEGFLERGWVVVGCARKVGDLEGGYFAEVDVRDEEAVKEFCEGAFAETGAPDLLVNNAGLMNSPGKTWEISGEDFGAVVDVNIKGVGNVIRHAVPLMIGRGTGVVVNFSSGWGRGVSAEVAPYCATKWAVEGLSQAMAEELPKGMAVVALNPGVIDTEMLRKCWGESAGSFETAEEWGKVAVPFLEGLSAKDNGKSLTVG